MTLRSHHLGPIIVTAQMILAWSTPRAQSYTDTGTHYLLCIDMLYMQAYHLSIYFMLPINPVRDAKDHFLMRLPCTHGSCDCWVTLYTWCTFYILNNGFLCKEVNIYKCRAFILPPDQIKFRQFGISGTSCLRGRCYHEYTQTNTCLIMIRMITAMLITTHSLTEAYYPFLPLSPSLIPSHTYPITPSPLCHHPLLLPSSFMH